MNRRSFCVIVVALFCMTSLSLAADKRVLFLTKSQGFQHSVITRDKNGPQKPAATYCQSGGRAAMLAFTLELMGGKDVRNYYKSWAEWGNADDTPIVVQPKKQGS